MTEAPPRRERPAPKPVTPDRLRRAALYYLQRYSSSAEQLRSVLSRRVVRSCRHHGQDPASFEPVVAEIVASCIRSGLVDDARFAQARAATLRRKGRSARAVSAGLAAKGVARELVAATVSGGEAEELAAALIAARRRRIGPWTPPGRERDRQRQLGVLLRAGFAMAIARRIVDAADEDSV
jgi:regulatory protein